MSKEVSKKESASKEVVVTLSEPVTFGSETISEVVLQPIRGRHIRHLPAQPAFDDVLKVAAKASGLSDKVFDLMAASDLRRIVETVGELL